MKQPSKEQNRKRFSPFKPRDKQPNFILSVIVSTVALLLVAVLVRGMGGFGAVMGIAKSYYCTTP